MNPTAEIWKPVVGWEDRYEVSDHGRVRSVDRVLELPSGQTRRYKGRVLNPGAHPAGHQIVGLYRDGKGKHVYVHTLVLEAFAGPRPGGCEALHWDDDPTNNNISNIRWGSRSDNLADMLRNGRHYQASQNHCKRGHEFTPDNTYKNGPNGRGCKTCRQLRNRKYQEKRHPAK